MATPQTTTPAATSALILDVDTGIDDALALAYAASAANAELIAATCVGGNTDVRTVAGNTLAILDLAGRPDVPVAVGRPGPIARGLQTTPTTHGPTGTGYARLAGERPVDRRDAVTLLVETARARPGEITLVTLGPLTNLAAAVLTEPELPALLRDVVVMGGVFAQAGNTTPRVEWNVHVDPEAARVVLRQWESGAARGGSPLTLCGLDVTETCVLLPEDLFEVADRLRLPTPPGTPRQRMAHVWGNPLLDTLRDALRYYFEFHAAQDGFYGAHVHDPFVVGVALDRTLVTTRDTTVDIELGGRFTDGETIADWRRHWNRGVNARVAVQGDGPRFHDRLLDGLTRACQSAGG